MSVDLRELYQEIILDHSRHPRNAGAVDNPTGSAYGNNPLCGDRITVTVSVRDGRIADAKFDARGCAISVASASMMTELMKGKTVDEARALFDEFHDQLTGDDPPALDETSELSALMGVRDFPTRIKCATLPWYALTQALEGGEGEEVTTE